MDEHAPEAAAFGSDIVGATTAIMQPWRPPQVSVAIRDQHGLPPEAGSHCLPKIPPPEARVPW